jgi:hypothetical protein
MYGIFLINQAGETVASVGWDHLEGDVSIFGGFVSAVQMFIKRISGGTQVEELKFGNMKLLIGTSDEHHVVTLHESTEEGAEEQNREVMRLLHENNDGVINDGLLGLISEMVSGDSAKEELVSESVKEWSQSQVDQAKKSASDWGKTVF